MPRTRHKPGKEVEYRVPPDIQLIIVDAHDTILKRDMSYIQGPMFGDPEEIQKIAWTPREGLLNFLTFYAKMQQKSIVISSDGNRKRLQEQFERFGIADMIRRVYGEEHLDTVTSLKNLETICQDMQVPPEQAVFIGDSDVDQKSAEKYGVRFIRVPNTLEDRHFSFNSFIVIDPDSGMTGLEIHGIKNVGKVHFNLTTAHLYEHSVQRGESRISHNGPLVVDSGENKTHLDHAYIVKEPSTESKIWWGDYNRPLERQQFDMLYARLLAYLQGKQLFVQDCYCGADPRFRIPIRVITETAWHSLFARDLLVETSPRQMRHYFPEYTILHMPNFRAIPELDGTKNEAFIVVNFLKKIAIVGGTAFAGEIRICVFIIMSHLLPHENVLPLLCSANKGMDGDVTLFFGSTGAGKTSLSLDINRPLIGDTFHGWSEDGIFNLEWGCYGKVKGYSPYYQRHIYECTRRFGTILENVYMDERRRVDLNNTSISEEIRAAFPFTHLENADRTGRGDHPTNIILLVRDGFGIFPSIARLTPAQACFYFLCGYSCNIHYAPSGTVGSVEPMFQSCFGSFPNVLHPTAYARLLLQRIIEYEVNCWLVNTGWLGPYQSHGHPITLTMTRQILNGIFTGTVEDAEYERTPVFDLEYPVRIEGILPGHTNVLMAWRNDMEAYTKASGKLAKLFIERFQPYEALAAPEVKNAAPRLP